MKQSNRLFILFLLAMLLMLWIVPPVRAQVSISNDSTATPHASAMLDVSVTGTSKKGVLIPRMTQAEVTAIASPATGLLVYQTDGSTGFYYYNGASWTQLSAGATGPTGPIGPAGLSVLNGDIDPSPGTGVDGEFYINTTSKYLFGPKAAGTWPDGVPLIGPSGPAGADGALNAWGLSGSAGTVDGTNFIGTTDAQALDIRTNNVLRTRITTKGQIETHNTGQSVFVGGGAGANDDLTDNLNVFVGYWAGFSNTTGFFNTANGVQALYSNTTGNSNTANGYRALFRNSTGFENTANGERALYSNTTGSSNIANGYEALYVNTTGYNNTALGWRAGSTVTTGSNLTLVGHDAEPTSASATNQITLGDASVASLRCAVTTITSLSDARDKKNIQDLSLGLDFISKLKPRQFNWDKREWYKNNISDGSKMQQAPTAGFIAQELDEAQTTQNTKWLNLVLKDNPEKIEATPGNLLPIMVKAIQELNKQNKELTDRIAALEAMVKSVLSEKQKTTNTSLGELR